MPRLTFGVQKLLNQWVNVNKDHVVYLDEAPQSSSSQKSGRKQRSASSKSTKRFSDDHSIVTASTASTSFTASTASTSFTNSALSVGSDFRRERRGSFQDFQEENTSSKKSQSLLVNKDDASISLQDLNFVDRLKRGTFGATYKGTWNEKEVTIKVVTPLVSPEMWMEQVNKLSVMTSSSRAGKEGNAYFAEFFGSSVLEPTRARGNGGEIYCLVSEYIAGMNLADLRVESNVPVKSRWKIMEDISKGMEKLHSFDMIHGNLKPENIVVRGDIRKSTFDVKIVNFGISKFLKKQLDIEFNSISIFQAPEAASNEHLSKSSDVYSFAFIAWSLFSRDQFSIKKGEENRPKFPKGFDSGLVQFMERCWHEDQRERPSFVSIVATLKVLSDKIPHIKFDEEVKTTEEGLSNANDKMAQLTVRDCESVTSNDSLSSKWSSSKKNRFLGRVSQPKIDTEDVEKMTNSQRKRLLRIKRPKRSKNKDRDNNSDALMSSMSSRSSIIDASASIREKDDDDTMSEGTSSSIESETSIERGAPPYKKHAPIAYSYAPVARAGMVVPQGVAIEFSHVAQGVPLVQPALLGPGQSVYSNGIQGVSTRGPNSQDSDNCSVVTNEGATAMFFYDHCPKIQGVETEERPRMKLRRSDSEPHSFEKIDIGHRRATSANNFVVGKNTVLEYVPSVGAPGLKAPFPTMSAVNHDAQMTFHVHSKTSPQLKPVGIDVNPGFALTPILEKSELLPQAITSHDSSQKKEVEKDSSSNIIVTPSLCQDVPGLSMPSMPTTLPALSTHIIHQKPSTVSIGNSSSTSSTEVQSSTQTTQDDEQSQNMISPTDESDARLDAASVLYSQFSAQSNEKIPPSSKEE